jgi:NAD(P)-dependent dehydrogenase (short-subunit alcohol dehydrogenase family)
MELKPMSTPMADTKTALITGASSGIGEAIARQLLADGYRVYAGARRVDRMLPLTAAGATVLALDVTDDASMVAAIAKIKAETGRLDVLVNNAGYGSFGALEEVPPEEGRRQFDVNVFGLARMTQLALPMMRERRAGSIVNISSIGGKIYEPFGSWYHATKFAVEGMSDCLRMELAPFGINVIIIEPGAIKSEWNTIARDSLRKVSGRGPYAQAAEHYARMLAGADRVGSAGTTTEVAHTVSAALKAARPRTRYPVGGNAGLILFLRGALPDRAVDRVMALASKRLAKAGGTEPE